MGASKNYVLRMVYISPTVDDELRIEAFRRKKTKNDVIRSFIEEALAARPKSSRSCSRTKARSRTTAKS